MPRAPARVAAETMAGVVGPPDIGAAISGMDIPNWANIWVPFGCGITLCRPYRRTPALYRRACAESRVGPLSPYEHAPSPRARSRDRMLQREAAQLLGHRRGRSRVLRYRRLRWRNQH